MRLTIPHIRSQKVRPYVLPFAILVGIIFHGFFGKLSGYSHYLIFLILFVTLCDMDYKQIRITGLHIWLLLFQLVVSVACYFIFLPFGDTLAQGAFMGILAPVAVSSTVVAVILGGNAATMVTYTILYNLVLSIAGPVAFSLIRFADQIPFWAACWIIIKKVFPIIVGPFFLAFFFQKVLPRTTKVIVSSKMLPFYLWAGALTIVIGQTIDFIVIRKSNVGMIAVMSAIALVECIIQFGFGRWVGKKYGDTISGGQALGQKNGVLSIWMTMTYLDPLASVVPASYIIWQNIWNSIQIWMKNRKDHI